MFFAINSKTNEKVNSITLESNPSYQFIKEDIWFADSDEIEDCPKGIDINKIIVKFREGARDIINWNGTKYDISPHFFIPNKEKLGINTIPETKEHKLAKNWVYNRIIKSKKELIINYSQINKPYKYKNSVKLSELFINKEMIGIETSCSTFGKRIRRRADVICPFISKHQLFGNGIVFEIQFQQQRKTTEFDRELDWAIRGYSVCWLSKEDFNFITDILIDLKKDNVNVSSWASLIKQSNKQHIKNLKYSVQELCRKLDFKKQDIFNSLKEKFEKILTEDLDVQIKELVRDEIDNYSSNFQPICPRCNIRAKLIDWNESKFWGCSNYPDCKWTSAYAD